MSRTLIAVFLMALVTYIPRVLPMAIFRKDVNSKFINSFLYYIPYTVLASLTFPDIFSSTSNLVSALTGTATALILAYYEKSLVIVAIFSMVSVYINQLLINVF